MTHGGAQRRGAVWPEIEARQKGHFFQGDPNGLLDITKAHPGQHPPGPDPIPVPMWTLGPTDETHIEVRWRGSARSENHKMVTFDPK